MVKTRDPMLSVFRARHDPAAREAYMKAGVAEADERNGTRKNRGGKKAGKKQARIQDL